ncbi:MAG: TetR/AcrR family transcriptional regulator [Flavobacteriaceae bacterium]|jgi:AcrR family transcriptional regulator
MIITNFKFPEDLALRDPLKSELGKKILTNSVLLIDDIGFESFTFKKLAIRIESNETTLYRYFENKHNLLLYLVVWYWNWVDYLIDYNTNNIEDPNKKLDIIIDTFVDATKENSSVNFINEKILHNVVVKESSKSYHVKNIDEENKLGFFRSYKDLIRKVSDVILEINPKFPYPRSFATNLFEIANNEIYFGEHLPSLTNIEIKNNDYSEVNKLLKFYKSKVICFQDQ